MLEAAHHEMTELSKKKQDGIVNTLKLLRPIYRETARHGHFGRSHADGGFTWEKTDKADALAKAAGISMRRAG